MSELAIPIQCTLCPRKFYGPAAALIGDQHAHGAQRLIQQLMKHVAETHEQEFLGAQVLAAEYQGWRILSIFQTDDPKVNQQWDLFRWKIHQASLRCRAQKLDVRAREVVSEIESAINQRAGDAGFAFTDEDSKIIAAKIHDVLKELRDILEEPNLYTPAEPVEAPKSPIVTV
jgi:hypothetical protein